MAVSYSNPIIMLAENKRQFLNDVTFPFRYCNNRPLAIKKEGIVDLSYE